jgi:hypothetical protein
MIKTINILLIITLIIIILFLSIQRKGHKIDVLKSSEKIIYLSYNNISIKQIDSLSSNNNLKFSELLTERIKIN